MSAIAQLKALFSIDTKQAESAVDNIGSKVKALGANQLAGLKGMIAGAFSVGAIAAFGRSLMQTADNMANIAAATNLTMGQLVALKTISAENNVKFDDLATTLGKLRNAQGEVVNLSKPMESALARLKISADEFVAADTDAALEMIARAFVAAGGSASAFSAVQDILGRNTKGLVEMLNALANEGLPSVVARTQEATKGFEEIAAAQSALEKAGNTVVLWAAKTVGAISSVSHHLGKLTAQMSAMDILKSYGKALVNPVYAVRQAGKLFRSASLPEQEQEGVSTSTGTAAAEPIAVSGAGQSARDQRAANLLEAERRIAAKRTEQITENEKRRDEIYREMDDLALETAARQKDILAGKGMGAPDRGRVDSLQAIGGIIGGVGGGVDRNAERQFRILQEMKKEIETTNRKLEDLNRKLEELAGVE